MKRDIIIIGAGIMGLTTAYELLKAGRKVTIIDESDITNSTSFGNAGLLSAFDKGPLANPGIVFNTLKLMLKGESPVNIHPTLDIKIYKWLWKFVNSANKDRLKRTLALFEKYGHISNDLYERMQSVDGLDFDFHRKGMLSVFTEQSSYDKKLLNYAIKNDDIFEIIEKNKIKDFIPCITNEVKGAIHFKRNTHFDPKRVMLELKRYLKENGAEFILNERITHIKYGNKEIESLFMPDGSQMSIMETIGIFQSISKNSVEGGVRKKDNSCNRKIIVVQIFSNYKTKNSYREMME